MADIETNHDAETEVRRASRSGPAGDESLRILVVDDEREIGTVLTLCLEADGHFAETVTSAAEALGAASSRAFDLCFLDLRLGTENGLDLIQPLRQTSPWLRIIVITAFAAVDTAVEAMKRGASDYLPKPFAPAQVRLACRKVAELRALEQQVAALQEALGRTIPAAGFATTCPAMRAAIETARVASASNATILIRGEPGTGKRTLARAIHGWSGRSDKPLTFADCRAPAPQQLESDWFGLVRRGPTGGRSEQAGRLMYAEGGTLVLEEVGDLPDSVQPKLLRLLQDRQYERVGEFAPRDADVRVVATTASDLGGKVAAGSFRADLRDALGVVVVDLPPLRRRGEDVVRLAEAYATFFSRQQRRPGVGFTEALAAAMRCHSWPGNVRELRNFVERAVILARKDRLDVDDFPEGLLNRYNTVAIGDPVSVDRVEEMHIRSVLAGTPSIDAAAKVLGMDSVTLWRRRKAYGI